MEANFREVVSGRKQGLGAGAARVCLAGAAVPYRTVVKLRNWLYDHGMLDIHDVRIPVVSVGNLTLGGTGKTPFVEFLCRWLTARGHRVAILSRGYGKRSGPNDEFLLLQANLPEVPQLQDRDRVGIANFAIARFQPDCLVLDDGFQHRRLARSLDIVLVDCTNPFGYEHIFPRGMLREPHSSLARASLIVLTRNDQCSPEQRMEVLDRIAQFAPEVPVILSEHRPASLWSCTGSEFPLFRLRGARVAAFCGIGNPEPFWRTLRDLGTRLLEHRAFPDHHDYTAQDLSDLNAWAWSQQPDLVVTTQKDLVKIEQGSMGYFPLMALRIALAVTDGMPHLERALGELIPAATAERRAA